MVVAAVSDLASSLLLKRTTLAARNSLNERSIELTTGIKQDLFAAAGGDSRRIYAMDNQRSLISAYLNESKLADARSTVVQSHLATIQESGSAFAPELLSALERNDMSSANIIAKAAPQAFENTLSALNATYAGQSLFSGAAYSSEAVSSRTSIMSDIQALVSGLVVAQDVVDAVEDYFFDPAGGYTTSGYQGSTQDAAEVQISESLFVQTSVRADDDRIKQTLFGLALIELGSDGTFSNDGINTLLFTRGGNELLNAPHRIIDIREQVGIAQETIEVTRARHEAQLTTLDIKRIDLIGADQFESAADVEALQFQLQSIYTITARMASLTLTNFLR
jgi:flagellar hook-associated protein 3 FlgL